MISIALYFLACFGFAYIVGHSTISLAARLFIGGGVTTEKIHPPLIPVVGPWLISLLECPACIGFWEGLAAGYLLNVAAPFHPLALALATAGANFILGRLTRLI